MSGVELTNWVEAADRPADADDVGWFQRVLAAVAAMNPPPVLVNLNPPFDARQGGQVLCRQLLGNEYTEGGPMWGAPG